MTARIDTITSAVETAFSAVPNGITASSTDTTLKLATTAFVKTNLNTLSTTFFRGDTDQTLTGTGTLTFSQQQNISEVDTLANGDTLVIGELADSNGNIGQSSVGGPCQLFIKTYLQPITNIWKFWGNGSINLTPSGTGVSLTSTAVLCKKIQAGSFTISLATTPITFSPAFTTIKPIVLLTVRSITTGAILNINRWVSGVGVNGFSANISIIPTNSNLIMQWFAIGN